MPAASPTRAFLDVRDLAVYYGDAENSRAVSGINFEISAGEILGIQGRSGCGKTSIALALLKLLPQNAWTSGSAFFDGRNLLSMREADLRKIRGRHISIIYQEPGLALNPVMRVGDQIAEVLRAHTSQNSRERKHRVCELLESVRLSPERFYRAYPHELSGGERHRVVLAQALACSPSLVIADEPTAGLDAVTKAEIVELIARLRKESGAAFLLISHDAGVVHRLADRTIELDGASKPNEVPTAERVCVDFSSKSVTVHSLRPLVQVRNLSKWYAARGLFRRKSAEKHALSSVDLVLHSGAVVALVGPSGSGKSTLARCVALLEEATAGEILLEGKDLLRFKKRDLRMYRPCLQYIAQDAAEALNPRFTALDAIAEPLLIRGNCNAKERTELALSMLQQVGLDPASSNRSCHEFSGGQKQRIVIARALTLKPRLLIFDESFSGLDPETQNGILNLVSAMKTKFAMAQLLISHDLDLVARVADRVVVMHNGRIAEETPTTRIAVDPQHWAAEHVLHQVPERELVATEAE